MLLLLLGVASAHAGVGQPFLPGGDKTNSPKELAEKIRDSLQIDPKGNRPVDRRCQTGGYGCATPSDYLDMLNKADPSSEIGGLEDLPNYLTTLVVVKPPSGYFWMACLSKKKGHAPIWNCFSRKFKNGEKAWQNPHTGKVVIAADCGNPVDVPDVPDDKCLSLYVELKRGDEVHLGWLGNYPFPGGECKPSILKSGGAERGAPLLDECPREDCDFSGPSRDLGNAKVWEAPRISWTADRDGMNVIRLPKEVAVSKGLFALCVETRDGRKSMSTFVSAGFWEAGKAFVVYEPSSLPHTWKGVASPWRFTTN